MVHGPLTASNLLVTWRRRHGDARITRQLARSRDWSLKKKKLAGCGGYGEVQSFRHAPVPRWSRRRQHLAWENAENQRGMKGERRRRDVFKSFPFFLDSAEHSRSHLAPFLSPPRFRWHLKLHMQVEYFCLCACVRGRFYRWLHRFPERVNRRQRRLRSVNKTSA